MSYFTFEATKMRWSLAPRLVILDIKVALLALSALYDFREQKMRGSHPGGLDKVCPRGAAFGWAANEAPTVLAVRHVAVQFDSNNGLRYCYIVL